jgi:hypothetical protein
MSKIKWILVIFALLGAAIAALYAYNSFMTNPKVTDEIQSDPGGERAKIVMLLTFTDGSMLPVNYLREEATVFAGADGGWWRKLEGGADVTLFIQGETFTGHADVVLDDPDYVHAVFARLRPKAPAWLPDWLNGKLVVIKLETDGA